MVRNQTLIIIGLATALTLATSTQSFAGQWLSNGKSLWWQNDDGTYPVNSWQLIDGNYDGIGEYYYFDMTGSCMLNTVTPDGNTVNAVGAWVIDGTVVQQQVANQPVANNAPAKKLTELDPVSKGGRGFTKFEGVETTQELLWAEGLRAKNSDVYLSGPIHEEYYLGGIYHTLSFSYAAQKDTESYSKAIVRVYGSNDELLWESEPITYKTEAQNAIVDVSHQQYIRIAVTWNDSYGSFSKSNVLIKDPILQ